MILVRALCCLFSYACLSVELDRGEKVRAESKGARLHSGLDQERLTP